jgi:hypothetical protein
MRVSFAQVGRLLPAGDRVAGQETIHVRSALRAQRVSGEVSLSDTEFRTWWQFICGPDSHAVSVG